MNQLTFVNADNDQPTQTIATLHVAFTHASGTTEAEAEAIVVEALTAYAKRQGLDIYLRDESEKAIGVDETLLLPKIESFLRKQIVEAMTAQRMADAEASARTETELLLLGDG